MQWRIAITALVVSFVVLAGCMGPIDDMGVLDESCPVECPDDQVAVDQCPAFTDCEEFPECDDPNVCAPVDEVQQNNQNETPDDLDCDEPVGCPPGSQAVETCPEGSVCTAISVCDETLLCRESPGLCELEPPCPGPDRHIEDCQGVDDDHCYVNHHCSGPVSCLECYAGLPHDCPTGTDEIEDPDRCDDPGVSCLRVETCEETLTCGRTCIQDADCPEQLQEVDDCGDREAAECITIAGCDALLSCAAPDADDNGDCDETPACPDGYQSVDVDECLVDIDECLVETACGQLSTCLPDPE